MYAEVGAGDFRDLYSWNFSLSHCSIFSSAWPFIIFNLAKSGDDIAREAIFQAAKRLGIKIAYLVNLLNPEVVVLGGGLEDAGEDFIKQVNATVKDWAFRNATEDLRIIYSQLRENAVALGAASLVMQKIFAQL